MAVRHYLEKEWARHLDDIMIRRTRWHYYHRDAAELTEQVAGWMAEYLGWNQEERQAEIERYRQIPD